MTAAWPIIAALVAGTVAFKAVGPMVMRRERPPARAISVITLLAPALLTALVVEQTLGATPSGIHIDARLAGVAVAALAALARVPMTIVIALAAITTALVRLL